MHQKYEKTNFLVFFFQPSFKCTVCKQQRVAHAVNKWGTGQEASTEKEGKNARTHDERLRKLPWKSNLHPSPFFFFFRFILSLSPFSFYNQILNPSSPQFE